ncbi:type VII secretion protein EsxB [Mycobacterium sp. 1554424.7]|nr:type VII secretion protein EsxB [Mycobacterium sp. 1554424.7]
MAEMRTDAATLSAEAGNFDKISGELRAVMGQVEQTGGELAQHFRGPAGVAAQEALARFHEKAQNQSRVLDEIVSKISGAGIQYTTADDDATSTLASQMNF